MELADRIATDIVGSVGYFEDRVEAKYSIASIITRHLTAPESAQGIRAAAQLAVQQAIDHGGILIHVEPLNSKNRWLTETIEIAFKMLARQSTASPTVESVLIKPDILAATYETAHEEQSK